MILTYTKRPARVYALAAAALGVAALAVSLPSLVRLLWDARYLMLAFCALTLGTRVYVKVPHAARAVPLSSALVLLAGLRCGRLPAPRRPRPRGGRRLRAPPLPPAPRPPPPRSGTPRRLRPS